MAIRFDEPTLTRLRRGVMKRGRALAEILADLLAGKDRTPSLKALLGLVEPGLRPEERVRLALDQIERRRALIDAGDDGYGRCDVCGVDLGLAALDQMPWADRCPAHAHA
jgi:hypothetical protein